MTAATPLLDVTDATFDTAVIGASSVRPVVVDFWAGWCAPCRTLGPILEQAVALHGGVTLAKLDVDANPSTARDFQVVSIPTLILFKDGQPVKRIVGAKGKAALLREIADVV